MRRATLHSYLNGMPTLSILMIVYATAVSFLCGREIDRTAVQVVTMAVPIMVYLHLVFISLDKCNLSFVLSAIAGFFSGVALTLAARVGLALNYVLWAATRAPGALLHIFIESWTLYIWMGAFGMTFFLLDPFFRIVLHRELFKTRQPSPFWKKYAPKVLIAKYIFHKDYWE